MNASILKLKWTEISGKPISGEFKSLRIANDCIPDIYIGVSKEGSRCLILAVPQKHTIDFKSIIKENLTIRYYKETNFIVLELTDNAYNDIFDDLILSLYQRIKDIAGVKDYCREFIQAFYKWSEFFSDKSPDVLSLAAVKGIFGELLVLRSLVNASGMNAINDILIAWKGPYDLGHDFVLPEFDIEVKTKELHVTDITISSEFQLESDPGKRLELYVISVEIDPVNGLSIKELAIEIKSMVSDRLGDNSIFLKALRQKGLSMRSLDEYDHFRFRPVYEDSYDCMSPDFPKLVDSQIPVELNSLVYNIRIVSLVNHIIHHKVYPDGNRRVPEI